MLSKMCVDSAGKDWLFGELGKAVLGLFQRGETKNKLKVEILKRWAVQFEIFKKYKTSNDLENDTPVVITFGLLLKKCTLVPYTLAPSPSPACPHSMQSLFSQHSTLLVSAFLTCSESMFVTPSPSHNKLACLSSSKAHTIPYLFHSPIAAATVLLAHGRYSVNVEFLIRS